MHSIFSGISEGMTKVGLSSGEVAAVVGGTAAAGIAVADAIKTKNYPVERFLELVAKDAVDSKKYIKDRNPEVTPVTDIKAIRRFINKELPSENPETILMAETELGDIVDRGDNAMAVYTDKGKAYVIAPKKLNPLVIDHELGHIEDFKLQKAKGIQTGPQSLFRNLGNILIKNMHDEDVIDKEKRAWSYVGKDKEELEESALNTYNRSFYATRSRLLGNLGGFVLGAVGGKSLGSAFNSPTIGAIGGAILGSQLGSLPSRLAG